MLKRGPRWLLGLSVAAVVGTAILSASTTAGASSSADWPLNDHQIGQARQALMLVSTQSDPNAAGRGARATGAWPANIQSARAFGTNRAVANEAMGSPKAAPADDEGRLVVCTEAHGTFSTAGVPRPPGAPIQTFSFAIVCFDPATGDILDSGFDDKPAVGTFDQATKVDVSQPITATVK